MKLKRLLTGVLSAVMALSVCAMPALAVDDNNAAATPKTGNLTITKYEVATGKTSAEYENKKGDPLAGVTFTVYKVAEVNQTVDANGTVSLSYDLVDTLKKGGVSINWDSYLTETEPKQYDSAAIFKALYNQLTADGKTLESWNLTRANGTTDDKGEAKFESLATGVYMVEETSAPAQITIANRTANFMVSIPMTVTKENGTQEITYNVKAEPKNVSTYGGVTLNKYGQVAGSSDKTLIAGAVFQLYRDNGSEGTPKWEPVDLTAKGIKVGNAAVTDEGAKVGKVTTTANGVNITGLTPGNYYFKEISAPAGYIADTKTEHKFKLDDNGDVLVDNAKVDGGVVEVVNEKPDFEKVVTKRDGTKDNHNADYGIGDKVPYTLTVKVPSTIANLKTFYVTDSINPDTDKPQLKYDETSFEVACSDGTAIEKDTNYTITFNKTEDGTYTGFTIDFKKGTTGLDKNFADKTIVIKYKAELLADAVTTNAGNVNKADLVYSNKTNIDSTEGELESDKNKIHDEGVVYTFQTGILKKDPNGTKLSGVEFSFYKKYDGKTDGTLVEGAASIHFMGEDRAVITGDAAKSLGLDSKEKWIEIKANEMTDETYGNIQVKGLPAGEYYWVETKALNGYNLLKEPVKADLNVTYKAGWTEEKEFKDGVWTKHEYKVSETTYPSDKVSTPITIVNRKGFTLPVTGGFGTLLFSGIGVLLVLAGVCVLFSMKKKNNRT